MELHLIKLDGKTVGIADASPQGVGLIQWFHVNKPSCSMTHAIEHEGYSVTAVDSIDCHDVESSVAAICGRAGVTMKAEFVPFSQSRNAKPEKGKKPWPSLNWRIALAHHGREFLTTDYSQGFRQCPAAKKSIARFKAEMVAFECEHGKIARMHSWHAGINGRTPIAAPSIGEVMQSLAHEADVLDAGGFESWAGEFGFDPDSRKAESTYHACMDIALKLRAALGATLDEIRLAAQFN